MTPILEVLRSSSVAARAVGACTSKPDRAPRMAELVEAGVVHDRDGFLCLMGKPLVH